MNPELRRNLWLEFSPHRLIAMPAILTLCFLLVYALNRDDHVFPEQALAGTALLLFGALCTFWGTRQVADSVTAETRAHTWDNQRLSALTPWELTWGKLLGAPSFCWYGGFYCLLLLALIAPPDWPTPKYILLLLCGTLSLHGQALMLSLFAARNNLLSDRGSGWLIFLLLSLIIFPWFGALDNNLGKTITWWGSIWPALDFSLFSLAIFAVWSIFGAYRQMCQELQVYTAPTAWLAFAVFYSFFLAGFLEQKEIAGIDNLARFCISGALLNGLLTYLMLFTEQTGALTVRRLLLNLQGGNRWRALQDTPCWLVSLLLASTLAFGWLLSAPGEVREHIPVLSLWLLGLRDTGLFLYFAFARERQQSAGLTTLLYLLVLYWLLPLLLNSLDLTLLASLVLPHFWEEQTIATLGILVLQAATTLSLAAWRWRLSTTSL